MNVIGKQGPGEHREMGACRHGGKPAHEVGPVAVVEEKRSPVEGPDHDVMERARGIESWATRHGDTITDV